MIWYTEYWIFVLAMNWQHAFSKLGYYKIKLSIHLASSRDDTVFQYEEESYWFNILMIMHDSVESSLHTSIQSWLIGLAITIEIHNAKLIRLTPLYIHVIIHIAVSI